jgi:hypothetical protein
MVYAKISRNLKFSQSVDLHSEYTISKKSITGEINTIWECRYESGIPKNQKVFGL